MIETTRLTLRPWTDADLPEFMRLTNVPQVMEMLGGEGSLDRFEKLFRWFQESQHANGFCFWIVQRKADGAMLGFCGLMPGTVASIANDIEIGWRLRPDAWGQGYAREAAEASLSWAWRNLDVSRIVAITAQCNKRSWGLMRRLGMTRMPEMDFDHHFFEPGHALRAHVTYQIGRPA